MVFDKNLIITEFITNTQDRPLYEDFYRLEEKLILSAKQRDIKVVTLTTANEFSDNGDMVTVKMDLAPNLKKVPSFFSRWAMAFQFLNEHPEIEQVALVDAGDVEMLNYPFDKLEDGVLYIGDEPENLFEALIIKENINPEYMDDFFNENLHLQLLNPGVICGKRAIILEFLSVMVNLLLDAQIEDEIAAKNIALGESDMAEVNYVAYRYFNSRLEHGRKVSTVFNYWLTHSGSWFRHK